MTRPLCSSFAAFVGVLALAGCSPTNATRGAGSFVSERWSGADQAAPVAPPMPTVFVHLDTGDPVSLERRARAGGPWQFACTAPCDANLPAYDLYRVVRQGEQQYGVFALNGPPGTRVEIAIHGDKWIPYAPAFGTSSGPEEPDSGGGNSVDYGYHGYYGGSSVGGFVAAGIAIGTLEALTDIAARRHHHRHP